MTFRIFAITMIALALGSSTVRAGDVKSPVDWSVKLANPVTKDVKASCEAKDAENQAYCNGVLMGLYDASFYIADAMEAQGLCIPETDTQEQMKAAFLDMTNKRSDQLLGPISIFYYMAMNAEFPCAKPGKPQPKTTK